jgi:uncharacterized protein CbrC (UPF0167 family)
MVTDRPFFRFNPGAYGDGRSFEPSNEICEACDRPCVWKYTGSIYALTRPSVCARCIADGRLGALLGDADFSLHDINIRGADLELTQEVLQRTPGVACFNPFEWPVLDAKPLAFIGYGEEKSLIAIPEVRAAMEDAFAEVGWDFGPSPYALLFREVDGERYRVVVDLD